VVPGLFFGLAAAWPFLETWVTGDRREHHINDRPRNAATRTGIAMAAITFWGILWAEGANDIIADHLDISLYLTTEISRYAIVIGPVVAYMVTKRICLGLQRKDLHLLEHGVETGIIRQLPSGGYIEVTRPVTDEERAVLEAGKQVPRQRVSPGGAVPAPQTRGSLERVRLALDRALAEAVPAEDANGHGNGTGHGTSGQPAAPEAAHDPSAP
jgi:ubiquinol-cytochrome c reductase cytochrome b subunit